MARNSAQAASKSTSTRQESVLFERSTATLTGVMARNSAASRPATSPARTRTICQTTSTAATPSSTCGKARLNPLKPMIAALNTCSQNATGGLSSETKPNGSKALKKNARGPCSILRTPAA